MDKSLSVLIAGLTGVFAGMLLLYISVKATALITGKFPEPEKSKEEK